jgi:hypothetical protein
MAKWKAKWTGKGGGEDRDKVGRNFKGGFADVEGKRFGKSSEIFGKGEPL